MSPRRYRMNRRSEVIEATRGRIVQAAIRLHARQGAAGTSWDEIATEAGVSRATVYHHFASLDQLVPACAEAAFDLVAVPTAEEAAASFAHLPTFEARLSRFVGESCRCYEAGVDWLRAAWRERDLLPPMAAAVDRLQSALQVLLGAVFDDVKLGPDGCRLVQALLDFPFWESLDRSGIPREHIPKHLTRLVLAVITRSTAKEDPR